MASKHTTFYVHLLDKSKEYGSCEDAFDSLEECRNYIKDKLEEHDLDYNFENFKMNQNDIQYEFILKNNVVRNFIITTFPLKLKGELNFSHLEN